MKGVGEWSGRGRERGRDGGGRDWQVGAEQGREGEGRAGEGWRGKERV